MGKIDLDDPGTLLRAIGELMIGFLAAHMTPEALARDASSLRAMASQQEIAPGSGGLLHPANGGPDAMLLRGLAALFEGAQKDGIAKILPEPLPRQGHDHDLTNVVPLFPGIGTLVA